MSDFSTTIKDGVSYAKLWPTEPSLAPLFVEQRLIQTIPWLNKVMPALAVITIVLPYIGQQTNLLPQSAVFALLFLAAPFHLYYWLGHRANTMLPPTLAHWYRELHHKLSDAGETMQPVVSRPRYVELADTLKKAFARFDKGFVIYGD
ncbi:terminus macrodomain insulation protein YfbV [Celerinatantimonas yamalensis]|uniref:UPF0208 membrane protein YfbV n=1 Tax=Celerinatantimonas yamalensis TaxID=559956 RepID=A0ABW9G6U5_9GAMM